MSSGNGSTRAQALANTFEVANKEFMGFVESCSDEVWGKVSEGEQWSVGVIAHHVAAGHSAIAGLVHLIGNGQAIPPLTAEQLNESNEQQAQKAAHCTQAEVLELAQKNGAQAVAMISSLSDEQLDRTAHLPFFGGAASSQDVIENVLIGHLTGHFASINATVG
ncbi:MAG: DinB family protein [Ardenticatenaceae bacterium]